MTALAFALLPALFVWALLALMRGSVFLSTALVLISASCFPAEFYSFEACGLTWTLDRLWFIVLIVQAVIAWCRSEHHFVRLEHCDVAVGMFFVWMALRTITQPLGSAIPEQPPTLMHLINGYAIPFTLYVVLRCSRLETAKLRQAAIALVVFAAYLCLTAFLEVAQAWSLVFPKFIADPDLGIHFGRARGPMLQSVRLGICLVTAWAAIAVYTIWLKPDCRFRWATFAASSLLLFAAIFLTYTRSVWMGTILATAVVLVLGLNGLPRRVAVFGLMSCCLLVGVIKGPNLVDFQREYSAAETRESTYMRAAFAYVSVEMFKDRPLVGYGFNQFQVYNKPYLADRSTNMRLESIRGYVHHNGFLSLLVDLGLIGIALYGFLSVTMIRQALILWKAKEVPRWVRGLALVAFAVGGSHIVQMAFHEVSFSSIENGILFSVCGLVVAANQQYCLRHNSRD